MEFGDVSAARRPLIRITDKSQGGPGGAGPDHPLRPIREIANAALAGLSDNFAALYEPPRLLSHCRDARLHGRLPFCSSGLVANCPDGQVHQATGCPVARLPKHPDAIRANARLSRGGRTAFGGGAMGKPAAIKSRSPKYGTTRDNEWLLIFATTPAADACKRSEFFGAFARR